MNLHDYDSNYCHSPAICTVVCLFVILFANTHATRAEVIEKWVSRYDRSIADMVHSIAIDREGNVVVGGSSAIGVPHINVGDWESYTAKYAAADGAQLWIHRYNGSANGVDEVKGVALDSHGDVYVTGVSETGNYSDCYTAKYSGADGRLVWEKRSTYRGGFLMLDIHENVIVAGGSRDGRGDYYSAKYAAANGAILWETRRPGTLNGGGFSISGMAIGNDGDVALTGIATGFGTYFGDYYTVKLSGTNGGVLWEKQYNGPGYNSDAARGVAVDRAGNVIVTGTSSFTGQYDIYTAKYTSANGSLIWETHYDNLTHKDDLASTIVLDGNDNVIVAGISYGGLAGADMITLKYAGTNGALVWDKRYNGPGNGDEIDPSVAVDRNGNVVVTVSSVGIGTTNDFYTAKYASAGGELLWEVRYNGLGNAIDYPSRRCLAIGPDEIVVVSGVSDSLGGGGRNYDAVTLVYVDVPSALAIHLTNGLVHLNFSGTPGSTYWIERAPLVSGPLEVIASPIASANGIVEYIDTNRPPGAAFYRTRTP